MQLLYKMRIIGFMRNADVRKWISGNHSKRKSKKAE